jgi:hypothetical protein
MARNGPSPSQPEVMAFIYPQEHDLYGSTSLTFFRAARKTPVTVPACGT